MVLVSETGVRELHREQAPRFRAEFFNLFTSISLSRTWSNGTRDSWARPDYLNQYHGPAKCVEVHLLKHVDMRAQILPSLTGQGAAFNARGQDKLLQPLREQLGLVAAPEGSCRRCRRE